jgi:hypothetical protein
VPILSFETKILVKIFPGSAVTDVIEEFLKEEAWAGLEIVVS